MRKFVFLCGILLGFTACEKDDEKEASGVVIEKRGCYPDSYLVEITDPGDSMGQGLACPQTTPVVSPYNCTNAAFIHLPVNLGVPGKKIRFVYVNEEISCLSSSGAPKHIIVKSVRAD